TSRCTYALPRSRCRQLMVRARVGASAPRRAAARSRGPRPEWPRKVSDTRVASASAGPSTTESGPGAWIARRSWSPRTRWVSSARPSSVDFVSALADLLRGRLGRFAHGWGAFLRGVGGLCEDRFVPLSRRKVLDLRV